MRPTVYSGIVCSGCSNHGVCQLPNGTCLCDSGFSGPDCNSGPSATPAMPVPFSEGFDALPAGWTVEGGAIVTNAQNPCRSSTGTSLLFATNRTRRLTSPPIAVGSSALLQFDIRLGDGVADSFSQPQECKDPTADTRTGIVLSYSINDGVTFNKIALLSSLTTLQTKMFPIPSAAANNAVIFQWWQPLDFPGNASYWVSLKKKRKEEKKRKKKD